jgi:hypothetical protein
MNYRLLTLAMISAVYTWLQAAIPISNAEVILRFDSLPSSNDWRAVSVGTDSGSGVVTTAAQLDEQVQTRSVASISNSFTQTTGVPSSFNYARWNAAGGFLQSRMGNNWCAVFVAILRNDTPTDLSRLEISYDVTTGPLPLSGEEVPGLRAYYSLTGEANSWVNIPSLSPARSGHFGSVVDFQTTGLWAAGAQAYLLWADDNSSNTDAYYTLDNLVLAMVPRLMLQPQPAGGVELSWADGWNHYQLQSASSPGSTNWQSAPAIPAMSDGRLRVILYPTNTMFFRLSAPNY